MDTATHPTIAIGAEVDGREGKIGEVSRVIVDPVHDRIDGVVVKRGKVLATERVVPLACFIAGDGAALRVDMDEDEFDHLDPFDETVYRASDPDYTGPPGFDRKSMGATNLGFSTYVAFGPQLAFAPGSPVEGYPGGESIRPHHEAPTIGAGHDVLDQNGDKVGEVAEFAVDPQDGLPVRLKVKKGFLFKSEYGVPTDWIGDISDGKVHLVVDKDAIQRLHAD